MWGLPSRWAACSRAAAGSAAAFICPQPSVDGAQGPVGDAGGCPALAVFTQQNAAAVEEQWGQVASKLAGKFPKVAELLAAAREDVQAFRHFPVSDDNQVEGGALHKSFVTRSD